MEITPIYQPPSVALEQLLLRDDLWMGHSRRFAAKVSVVATGHLSLDNELIGGGWPTGSLIDVCQQGLLAEWQLFAPALHELDGLIVLVNPPALPFCQGLLQAGIDLDRLVIVDAKEKADFLSCFSELVRAGAGAVLAWPPTESLTYTEQRKCQLAAAEDQSLCVMFRPAASQQQSSPAVIRLFSQLVPAGIEVTIFKQKGQLLTRQPAPVVLHLPNRWSAVPAYHILNKGVSTEDIASAVPGSNVFSLRGKP